MQTGIYFKITLEVLKCIPIYRVQHMNIKLNYIQIKMKSTELNNNWHFCEENREYFKTNKS